MSDSRPSVVVTGLGAVTPLGVGVPAFVEGLRAGRSGTRRIPDDFVGRGRIRSSAYAPCAEFDPSAVMSEADLRRVPRMVPMALAACREALAWARYPLTDDAHGSQSVGVSRDLAQRTALLLGTGAGGIDFTLDQAQVGYAPGATRQPSLWTITNATHGNLAGELSIRLGLQGPSLCLSTGCASSSDALGMAMEMLRSERPGAPEVAVVVGADAHLRWETLLGMEMLKVISTRDRGATSEEASRASRPFDRERDGFILGKGAWAMVLERAETARRREVRPMARALGYGVTCDAYHRVRPAPDMEQSARAMREAIEDAGLSPRDIGVVHYHGTGTVLNDRLETLAVKRALGEAHAKRVVGHSVKGAIGHPQGASGLAAAVATLAALTDERPFLLPTVNLDEPDVEGGCDLDYTPREARAARGDETVLVNCLAFGAKNSAVVLRAER